MFLREAGFKRERNHFHRTVPELVHGIGFQASQWGSAIDGSFTVNLVVTSPLLHFAWTGVKLPSNPATALSPIVVRLGQVMPNGSDSWWNVGDGTDLDELTVHVATSLRQFALPFFESFPDSNSVLARLRAGKDLPFVTQHHALLVHLALAAQQGLIAEAKEQAARALADPEGNELGVRLIANRVGIPIK